MTSTQPRAPCGDCPKYGAVGINRERRADGDDWCANGCWYPSASATIAPITPITRVVAPTAEGDPEGDPPEIAKLRARVLRHDVLLEQGVDTSRGMFKSEKALLAEYDALAARVQRAPVPAEAPTIDTGDAVQIAKLNEIWLVAFVRDGLVCCCGWPCSYVPLAECTLVTKATPAEREKLLDAMAAMSNRSDPRQRYAAGILSRRETIG